MSFPDEIQHFVSLSAIDKGHLTALSEHLPAHLSPIIDGFYQRVLESPKTALLLRDQAQVNRLKKTLARWLTELLTGPWDDDYVSRRMQIGHTHVRVGLPPHFMAAAMAYFSTELAELTRKSADPSVHFHTVQAIQRVCQFDLAIMTGTFVQRQDQTVLSRLQALIVSHIPVSIFLIDTHERIVATTLTGQHLFSRSSIIGQPYHETVPAHLLTQADLVEQVAHALRTGHEVELTRVDCFINDEARSFRIIIVPLKQGDVSFLLHFEELTDAVQTESRLRRAEGLAQLGALSAAVAHELRNPLAGISGAIQIIQRSMDETDRRKAILIKVDQQIRRLNELVTDLLAFARPQKITLECVNLHNLIESAIQSVVAEFPDAKISAHGEGFAFADPDLVHQICLNLLRNAVQSGHSPNHRVDVELGKARLTVRDTGPGVPPEIRSRIFQPFFTTRTQGTGLGLAISQKAAKELGGRLSLREQPPWGAVFELTLMPMSAGTDPHRPAQ